jgi:hypothetical protein
MDNTTLGLVGFVVALFFFLLIREIVCWYWKINQLVQAADKAVLLLERIAANTDRTVVLDDRI